MSRTLPLARDGLDDGPVRGDSQAMTLSCLRRAARAEDRLPAELAQALGPGLVLNSARRVAEVGGTTYWVVPTDDGQAVMFFGMDDRGGGGGIATYASLAERGAAAHLEIRGGRWRHVLLVADGIDRVRCNSVESPVTDNLVVFDLPDRQRLLRLEGPTGVREYDLGPSDRDDFLD